MLSLPDASAEKLGQRGVPARVVHLVAPLTAGESRLTVNGRLVHEGILTPGMLRLCNPADQEHRLIKKPLKVMLLTLPFKRFEQLTATALLADDLIS